jgi:hypothetical protein
MRLFMETNKSRQPTIVARLLGGSVLSLLVAHQATAVTTTIITLRGQISGFDARDPSAAQIDPGLLTTGDQFVVTILFHSDRIRNSSVDSSPLDPAGKEFTWVAIGSHTINVRGMSWTTDGAGIQSRANQPPQLTWDVFAGPNQDNYLAAFSSTWFLTTEGGIVPDRDLSKLTEADLLATPGSLNLFGTGLQIYRWGEPEFNYLGYLTSMPEIRVVPEPTIPMACLLGTGLWQRRLRKARTSTLEQP